MTTKAKILKTIRENCIDCVVGQIMAIEDCGGEKTCKMYPFRFGKDPTPSKKGFGSPARTAKNPSNLNATGQPQGEGRTREEK